MPRTTYKSEINILLIKIMIFFFALRTRKQNKKKGGELA